MIFIIYWNNSIVQTVSAQLENAANTKEIGEIEKTIEKSAS